MMKRSLLLCMLALPTFAYARINILEPWQPGLDAGVGREGSYNQQAAFLAGEHFVEIPYQFAFVPSEDLETGARWGLKSVDGKAGINDLMIAGKYRFCGETQSKPAIIAEAALILPTGDQRNGLGTGATGLGLHWALQKQVDIIQVNFGLGVQLNSENSDKVQLGNVFSYHAGGKYQYSDEWTFFGELKGANHGATKLDGRGDTTWQELYLAPGAEFHLNRTQTLTAALLIGLTSESNDLGLFAGFRF